MPFVVRIDRWCFGGVMVVLWWCFGGVGGAEGGEAGDLARGFARDIARPGSGLVVAGG